MSNLNSTGKNSREVRRALDKMYEISYENLCRLENTAVNPSAHYQYDIGEKSRYLFKPNFNRNANFIKIPSNLKYLRFSLPINITCFEDKKDKRKGKLNKSILSLEERGKLNRTSVEVYVDGVKVPDFQCYITVLDGAIDLYVPDQYFEENGSYLDILTTSYNKSNKYVNVAIKNVMGTMLFTELLGIEKVNINDIRIYKNGYLLLPKFDYNISFMSDNTFTLIFSNDITVSDIIEVNLDKNCIYNKIDFSRTTPLISFPSDLIPNLPISLDLCRIYIEGRRVFQRDIEKLTARHYKLKDSVYRDYSRSSVFVNYTGYYIEKQHKYAEDVIRFLNHVTDKSLEEIFLDRIHDGTDLDWVANTQCPPESIKINNNPLTIGDKTYDQWLDEMVKKYLEVNAHNIIPLLTQYAKETDIFYHYSDEKIEEMKRFNTSKETGEYDRISFNCAKVVFCFNKKYDTQHAVVCVDGLKILDSKVIVRHFRNHCFVYIDYDVIKGSKEVKITVLPLYNKERKFVRFKIDFDQLAMPTIIDINQFGILHNEEDLIVMKRTGEGYTLVKKENMNITFIDDKVHIDIFNRTLKDVYLVYNTSFYNYSLINVKDDVTFLLDFDSYNSQYDEYFPNLSRYSHLIYRNGILQAEGIDYFVTNQGTYDDIERGKIVFRLVPKKDDILEIYLYEEPKLRFGKCKVLDLDYDIIYFCRERLYGYSKNYMDLYVNGCLVKPENITEIALNLVAIKQDDIPRPYREAFVKSRFEKPILSIIEYILHAYENPSKWAEYIDRLINDNNMGEIGGIIDGLVPPIDNKPDNNNPSENDPNYYPEKPFIDPFLDLVAKKLRKGELPRRIDANEWLLLFKTLEFITVMTQDDLYSPTVSLDPNFNNLTEMLQIDATATLKAIDEVTEIVIEEMLLGRMPLTPTNKYDFDDDITQEIYDKYPISKKLYMEEVRLAQPDNIVPNLKETCIFDANEDIEESFTLESVSKTVNYKRFKRKLMPINDNNEFTFYFVMDLVNLSIYEFESLYINNLLMDENSYKYIPEKEYIEIYRTISPIDKVKINYKQKIYSK